jgi:hypothetical protein
MQRMVVEVEECRGTFSDGEPASYYDRHWCTRCDGRGWVVKWHSKPFLLVWRPRWWPWPSGSYGRWSGFVQVKQHD